VKLVGATTDPVRLQNVANGVDDTDAVNVRQLNAVSDGLNNLDGLAVKYDDIGLDTVTLAGTSGTRITNLANGDVNASSTDAINGSQLFNFTNSLGSAVATNLGGGATYNATTGTMSQPSYSVYGTTHTDVGAAITALQTQSPIQYLDASGNPTTTITDDVTLVGSSGGPVQLHNIAAGVAATDAVNVSQLQAVNNNVAALDALAVKYDTLNQNTITLNNGQLSTDGGLTGGTLLTNLQQGSISQFSTDAVNGAQLYETQQMITNINQGRIRYFQINSSLGEADASGADSMSIGPLSEASGDNSLALGVGSRATADGAVSIGFNSAATGVNSIAIGNGALATGSVAVGAGAQAGNGGAAFGDNAIALTPQQGTALGNAAVVTANRGVALGAGASASRAGMGTTNTRERFTNTAVTSTEGAVSVGNTGAERQITNVAGGTEDTDAVNVRQLEAAISQSGFDVSNQLNALRSDISTVRHDANAGTASAIALASMPQSVMPGKAMMAAGIGHYEGQSAMSIGVSNFSENGRWVINVNGSANTRGKAGAGVGVGFHW
jgi:autotransporter adhesin